MEVDNLSKAIIVVDCQNDFISGSLACHMGKESVDNIISLINSNKDFKVFYSCDWHSKNNKSFKANGGIWPIHCVGYEEGSELHQNFYKNIENEKQSPLNKENIFYKGQDDEIEEYSAFYAKNSKGEILNNKIPKEVIVCGIASEYCVRETIKEFLKYDFTVSLFLDGLGYVNKEEHNKNIEELKKLDVNII
ncbi:cysteine hydrolase [Clostridium tetani]|nr:cysteine hydrolase [Clostridium tetani]RXM75546.1 cysteine hydrolase [Clostridium tetani]RYU98789.1 cysteine hydrolase [Clostridium tetani]